MSKLSVRIFQADHQAQAQCPNQGCQCTPVRYTQTYPDQWNKPHPAFPEDHFPPQTRSWAHGSPWRKPGSTDVSGRSASSGWPEWEFLKKAPIIICCQINLGEEVGRVFWELLHVSVDCEIQAAEWAGEMLGSPMLVDIIGSALFQVVQYEREELWWGGQGGISLDWVLPVLPHHTSDQRTPGLVIFQLHKLLVVDWGKPGERVPGGKVSDKTLKAWKLFPPDNHNGGEVFPSRLNLFLFWRRPQFGSKHLVLLSISSNI